jgi:hypothetical protein
MITFRQFLESLEPGVELHSTLNPILWDNFVLKEEIRNKLIEISDSFIEYLAIDKIFIEDVIITGSNCSFTFTKFSDIDLHIVFSDKVACDTCPGDFIQDCFNAKKTNFNDNHHITIAGYPVELYAQPENDNLVAIGIFSIINNKWLKKPEVSESHIDSDNVKVKTEDFIRQINDLVDNDSDDLNNLNKIKDKIKQYRRAGLEKNLRNNGYLDKLYNYISNLEDKKLSY